MSNMLPFSTKYVKDQLDIVILSCIQSESFVRSTARYGIFLSVVVILLLVEMSCFYVHISNGSLMISSVAIIISSVVLIIMNFCIIFIVMLGMMIGLLLSFWRRFFVSAMMILEYSLVMAESCQRQN